MNDEVNTGAAETGGAAGSGIAPTAQENTSIEAAFEKLNGASGISEGNTADDGASGEGGADNDGVSADVSDTPAEDTASGGEKKPMTKEERAIYAKARRKAEADARDKLQRELADEKQKLKDQAISEMGILDPFTGKTIATAEEHRAYVERMGQSRASSIMEKAGISEEELKTLIEQTPEVVRAKELLQDAEAREKETQKLHHEQVIREELAEIGKFDANVKTIEDFQALDRFDEIYEKVMRGYSFLDAYKTVYDDVIAQQRMKATRNGAMTGAASKSHLNRTDGNGAALLTVPPGVREAYRMMGFTDAQINEEYQKFGHVE